MMFGTHHPLLCLGPNKGNMSELAISRRRATQTDMPFLVQLRHDTMRAHLAASGVRQSEEAHLQRVLVHFDSAEILVHAGEPVGLVKIVRSDASWELLQIQLHPSVQGQGVGTEVLTQLISEADAAQVTLQLSVLKANPARRLYERLGFKVLLEKEHSFDMQRIPLPGLPSA